MTRRVAPVCCLLSFAIGLMVDRLLTQLPEERTGVAEFAVLGEMSPLYISDEGDASSLFNDGQLTPEMGTHTPNISETRRLVLEAKMVLDGYLEAQEDKEVLGQTVTTISKLGLAERHTFKSVLPALLEMIEIREIDSTIYLESLQTSLDSLSGFDNNSESPILSDEKVEFIGWKH